MIFDIVMASVLFGPLIVATIGCILAVGKITSG